MHATAAGGGAPLQTALEAQADRLGLGLLLVESGGRLLFGSARAADLLGCTQVELAQRWQAVANDVLRKPVLLQPSPFTLDIADGAAAPRRLRGQYRVIDDALVEVLLCDPRRLGWLELELLCAARMREWLHQSEAIVHDANGALNTIQLTLELLDGQWPGTKAGEQVREPHRRNHVGVIRDNLGKLKTCLRQLPAVQEDVRPDAFDAREVLREAAATLKMPARRRRIELDVAAIAQPLMAVGNRARIRQALVNAVLARIEALEERSRIELAGTREASGRIVLTCTDGGTLSAEASAGIWLLLASVPGDAGGSEGLRLARTIVESEGGEFSVGQEEGTLLALALPGAAA